MTGWKTKLGALGVFLTGVLMIIEGIAGDSVGPDKIYQGLLVCAGALTALGIGHKIQKSGE